MNDMGYGGFGGPLLAIIGIWSFIGLGVYVWYLWALARLFPYLGLPAGHGWIPVWNQWRLIERGGLPGWTAIVGIVPGLNIVTIVMSIIAIHRINQEHEESGGMTVLGALLPPLWATMLGTRLQDRGYAAEGGHAGFARQGAQGLVEYGPDGQVYPLLPGAAQTPARQQAGMPPVPQAYGAPPAQPSGLAGPAGPAPAAAPRPAATPLSPGGFPAPAASGASGEQPVLPPSGPSGAAAPAGPFVPGAAATPPNNPWGLGNTTEGNFQRLASEQPPSREASFGSSFDSRPFSWPQPAPIPPEAPLLPSPAPAQSAAQSPASAPGAPGTPIAPGAPVTPGASGPTPAGDDAWKPSAQAVEAAAAAAETHDEESAMPAVVAETRVTAAEVAPVLPPLTPPVHPSAQAPAVPSAAEPVLDVPAASPTPGQVQYPAPAVLPEPAARPEPAVLPAPTALPEPVELPRAETLTDPAPLPDAAPVPAPSALPEPAVLPVTTVLPTPTEPSAQSASPASPASPAPTAGPAAGAPGIASTLGHPVAPAPSADALDDELDETVVVSRRARWALELPDGQQLELASDDVIVGRKPVTVEGADVLVIPDPTRTLSKSHARLRLGGDGWTIEDLRSTNGVFTIDAGGAHTELAPGAAVLATEELVIGTLEVRLIALD